MAKSGININTLDKELKEIISGIEHAVLTLQKDQVEKIYKALVGVPPRPVWTGYYASNHRIILRKGTRALTGMGGGGQFTAGGVAKLFPSVKPSSEKGSLVGNIGPATIEELGKLDRLILGDTVLITTRVPYADDVERNHGVYSGVAAQFDAA